MTRRQPRRLASARAYYRLAAKAEQAGQGRLREHYRNLADRLVAEERREREARERTRSAENAKTTHPTN